MPTVYDVPSNEFIERLKDYLKKEGILNPPQWFIYAKTGSNAERAPSDPDWYYYRAASILRKVYLHGPISVNDLAKAYGGRKRNGYALAHSRVAGRAHIRKLIKDLEAAGYIKKDRLGRVITPSGRSLMDKIATEIFEELKKENKILEKIGVS